jgi:hypothetical protein
LAIGKLPLKYLSVPITFQNLKNIDWDFWKKLDAWVCESATSGGRLLFLDSCLSGIPSFYMSMFLLNLTFIEKLNKHRSGFLGPRKSINENTIWSNGPEFVGLKTKVDLGLKT